MRVNARLDPVHEEKLETLCRRTGRSRTDVLRQAIDLLHAHEMAERGHAAEIMRAQSFIGCAEGDPDLASNYKSSLGESLQDKMHDHR